MVGGFSGWVRGHTEGLMEPQVPADPHSRLIPETKETTQRRGPGPPSQGRGALGFSPRQPLWTRGHWDAPHPALPAFRVAAGRPGGLVVTDSLPVWLPLF